MQWRSARTLSQTWLQFSVTGMNFWMFSNSAPSRPCCLLNCQSGRFYAACKKTSWNTLKTKKWLLMCKKKKFQMGVTNTLLWLNQTLCGPTTFRKCFFFSPPFFFFFFFFSFFFPPALFLYPTVVRNGNLNKTASSDQKNGSYNVNLSLCLSKLSCDCEAERV